MDSDARASTCVMLLTVGFFAYNAVSSIASPNTTDKGDLPPIMLLHGMIGTKMWAELLGEIDFPPQLAHLNCSEKMRKLDLKDGRYFAWLGPDGLDQCLIFALTYVEGGAKGLLFTVGPLPSAFGPPLGIINYSPS